MGGKRFWLIERFKLSFSSINLIGLLFTLQRESFSPSRKKTKSYYCFWLSSRISQAQRTCSCRIWVKLKLVEAWNGISFRNFSFHALRKSTPQGFTRTFSPSMARQWSRNTKPKVKRKQCFYTWIIFENTNKKKTRNGFSWRR